MKTIDTTKFSSGLRGKAIDLTGRKLLITKYEGSEQSKDLTEPVNCGGYGRIRHFKLGGSSSWPKNPLPIVPALSRMGRPLDTTVRAQVFQNAVCNWRCWYCYVDFELLAGNKKYSDFLSCDQLVDLYTAEPDRPIILDLSGGQPDLTPEWVPWMMETLLERGLAETIYLWSDDNLSNDYFWQFLSEQQIELIQSYRNYGRVCCFKGIDQESFKVNTQAHPDLFNQQFALFRRMSALNIDLYAYVTMTAASSTDFATCVPQFLDRLQEIHENLPLRTVPLRIDNFTPMKGRQDVGQEDLIKGQHRAMEIWMRELESRFSSDARSQLISEIDMR